MGLGFGESSSTKLKAVDNVDVGEITFGIGVRYQFNENIDAQIGYQYISTGFDRPDDKNIANELDVDQDNIMLSVAYKF
ncbi:MAG: outer membrane beta-barrel protein [Sulfurovaceae bacterium]|nr:outer membrane beta-barrel protein [Sulfurovaceae bacterium]